MLLARLQRPGTDLYPQTPQSVLPFDPRLDRVQEALSTLDLNLPSVGATVLLPEEHAQDSENGDGAHVEGHGGPQSGDVLGIVDLTVDS